MIFEQKKLFNSAAIFIALQLFLYSDLAWNSCRVFANDLQQAMNSVVSVLPVLPKNVNRLEEPEGSGVVINNGNLIVTARHVVDKASFITIRTWSGEILPVKLIGDDRDTDIALLKISKTLKPISISEHDPKLGERVCGIGNAFGLGLSLSCGIVSGLHKSGIGFNRIEDFIQTDTAVNPGTSGGALVNQRGELVGLISAIFTKNSDANIGINFAVSTELLNRAIPELVKYGKVSWPNLGMILSNNPIEGETGVIGVRIKMIRPGSIADKARFKDGDLVLKVGKRRIKSSAEFISVLSVHIKHNDVEVQLERNNKKMVLHIPHY